MGFRIAVVLLAGASILSTKTGAVLGAEGGADGPSPKQGHPAAHLDSDGMMVVGGQRVFILGCYWNPATTEGLRRLHEAGFNLVSSRADRASLDAIARQGLMAWIALDERVAPAGESEEKKLEELVRPLLDHPALVVWEVPDEALWNTWYLRSGQLAAEREKLRDLLREREKAGGDLSRIRALWAEETKLRVRADFEAAEAVEREIRQLLGAEKQNPDIQMSAAPAAAEHMRQRLLRGYQLLHRLDGRPVWMNFAPRNTMDDLRRYGEAGDIVGCDIYPAPVEPSQGHSDLANRGLSSVGDYTRRFREAGGGRAVWMVLQGFGWRDIQKSLAGAPGEMGRRPTRAETRFMLYDAIVHGARGVLYWGGNYAQQPPDFWRELCAVVREAADLAPVWAAPDGPVQPKLSYAPTWGSVDRPPVALAKSHGGKTYVLVVNEHTDGLGVRLSNLGGLDGARASLIGDPSGCALKGQRIERGMLTIHMPAFSVAIICVEKEG